MKHTKLISLLLFHILFSACTFAQIKAPDAELIMQKAIAEAAKSHRNVFIIFHASWCGWCHKMDNAMNDEKLKTFFTENYVVVHLTVDESKDKKELENPGADELRKKYHGEQQGLPYWFILDTKGNFLADARSNACSVNANEKPINVGCPASVEEVNYFVKVIKETSSLNIQQLALIQERFLKNKE
ncbi:MAG TPA: thioredoxin family protein [Chitinophagaceae bacterium]|nr:thioredoxin family protein [Chitinophagaceae bacterium]